MIAPAYMRHKPDQTIKLAQTGLDMGEQRVDDKRRQVSGNEEERTEAALMPPRRIAQLEDDTSKQLPW